MKLKEILDNMIHAAMTAKEAHDAMAGLGYSDTPYWDIFADIAEAIYCLIGEQTETFDESLTYTALYTPDLPDDQRVSILLKT